MAAKSSINIGITGDAKGFARELGKAQKETDKFEKGTKAAFGKLKAVGIGAAIGIGAAFVDSGLKFEAMEGILIRGTGASGDALEDLKTQATDVLKKVPESAEVVAGAIADVNTFFAITGDHLETVTGLFLDFARVADMDVGGAIAGVDALMTQFNEPLEETDELLGDLVRISQATGAPMETLLKNMEKWGPVFATAGYSAEEAAAMFGMLEESGVDIVAVGPKLEKFFADVAEAGGEPRQAFEDIVEQIQNATTETDALSIAAEAFGTAGSEMTSAIRDGNFDLEDFGDLMGEGTGLVDAQAEATATLSDKFATMRNKLTAAMGPIALELMDKFTVVLESVGPFIEKNRTLFVALAGVIGTLTGAFVAFKIATAAWTVISTAATVATSLWAAATWAVNGAIAVLTSPITAIVAAIALLVAGIILAYQNVDWFREAVDAVADVLVTSVSWAIDLAVRWFQYLWEQIKNIADLVMALFSGDFGGAWDALKEMASAAVQVVVDMFGGLPRKLWDGIYAGLAWVLSAGKMIGAKLLKGIGDALGAAVDWVTSLGKTIANALIGFINNLIDDLNKRLEIKIEGPGFLPDINLNPPDIPNIPLLAEGGIVDKPGGMLAYLGEAGPEAVIPLDRAGGIGGAPMTVNIYMPVGSDGDSVVRALQEYEARNGAVPVGTRSL